MAAATSLPKASHDDDARDSVTTWLRDQEQKELLRFVTIGSVDDGKSTLIGRLLHDAQGLYQDQLDAVRRASRTKGATRTGGSTAEIDFSLFTDGLLAEREQGITIDVAYRYFATARRKFIIADTPGHVQYTRNMATGASTAHAALILVDARLGVIAQTRRHAQIAALLGIPHVIACVNKMDLVSFDQTRFAEIDAELGALAGKLGLRALEAIPVSALAGDNVVTESARTPWWTGGTLLARLETIPVRPEDAAEVAFRLPVQLVIRPGLSYRGFAGQIASGSIAVGDEIVALPSGRTSRVVGIDVGDRSVTEAAAPASVALRLADEIDVSRGDLLARPGDLPTVADDLEADLVWMSERALERGRAYLLKQTTRTVRAEIEPVHGTDPETLAPRPADTLALNDIARVLIRARAPIYFDPYARNRATGAFILIDALTNDTVAAGMLRAGRTVAGRPGSSGAGEVTDEERRARFGQRGLVVAVATSQARAVERALFDDGRIVAVVEEQAAEAVARAGVIALVASETTVPREELVAEILAASRATASGSG
ncbi:MAG: GTP-binding protein [Labilithrix sp.]